MDPGCGQRQAFKKCHIRSCSLRSLTLWRSRRGRREPRHGQTAARSGLRARAPSQYDELQPPNQRRYRRPPPTLPPLMLPPPTLPPPPRAGSAGTLHTPWPGVGGGCDRLKPAVVSIPVVGGKSAAAVAEAESAGSS
eukprot:6214540-Pleurochrysis_carterae.AAC.7